MASFVQHSGMVGRRFRSLISGVIPAHYHRAVYSIASGIVLAGVVPLWQPTDDRPHGKIAGAGQMGRALI